MPVIIGLVGDGIKSRKRISEAMSENFEIKEFNFLDIVKGISTFAFPQMDSTSLTYDKIEKTFKELGQEPIPVLRENAKRILTSMIRYLGGDFRNYFTSVSSGKYAGGTYDTPAALLKRVDEIILDMMPDFHSLVLSSKIKMDDVGVVSDFDREDDVQSFRTKYPNFFLVEVWGKSKGSNGGKWYQNLDRNIMEKVDDLSPEDLLLKTEEVLKTVKDKVRREVPFPTEDFMSGDQHLRNGRFGFERR